MSNFSPNINDDQINVSLQLQTQNKQTTPPFTLSPTCLIVFDSSAPKFGLTEDYKMTPGGAARDFGPMKK